MKKLLCAFLSLIILISLQSLIPVCAEEIINIKIDGKDVVFNDTVGYPIVDSAKRTQVPFRVTMENFGCTVDWNNTTRTAIAKNDTTTIEVQIGKYYIIKNGVNVETDTPALVRDGRIYLPIRPVLEAFGAEVNWDNLNRSVIVSRPVPSYEEAEAIDFKVLLEEVNSQREESLKQNYTYDISKYMEDFSGTLNHFTEAEVRELLTRKARVMSITKDKALEDVETYFKYLESFYAAYEYFGGAKVFNEAKAKVITALSDKTEVSNADFAAILQNALSFIRDGHFSINNKLSTSREDIKYKYYRCDNQSYSKDDTGYYKALNGVKWYVTGFSNNTISIRPTLLSSGKIVYSPVFYAPVTQLDIQSQVMLSDGKVNRTEPIKWISTSKFNGYNLDVGDDLIADLSGTKYIPFRRPFFTDVNTPAYQNAGYILNKERVFVLDSRSNNGGGDRQQQRWFSTFTGSTFDTRDARAYKVNKIGIINFATFGNRYLSESAYLGRWRTDIRNGRWFSNDTTIIVLMDDYVGSSGENMINMLRSLDNVIFVGSNTVGCMICGNYTDIYLPNSGMPVRCGMMLAFPEKVQNIDGIGIEPDIWCNPSTSLEAVLNTIKVYKLN